MPGTPTARDLARRLIDREPARQDAADPAAAAVHSVCEQVYRDLSRWVGSAGSAALFSRALHKAESEHAVLADVRIRPDAQPRVADVGGVLQTGGSSPTPAALEAVLVELIELLSRLIGVDLVVRLLDRSDTEPQR